MVMSDLETYIQAMRKDVTGDVLSRSRTMDALLDLRLEAAGRDDVTSLVDAALADLPGKTMVPGDWYRERLDLFEDGRGHLGDDQLGDPISALDAEGLLPEIRENDLHLPSIVGVDGAGCIRQHDPVIEGKAATRADLGFEPGRQSHREARRNENAP